MLCSNHARGDLIAPKVCFESTREIREFLIEKSSILSFIYNNCLITLISSCVVF